jgi:CBS domain containing-hemolysin-like protein
MTTIEVAWRLLAVAVLVAANGFFVAVEFALVGADDTRLAAMEAKGDRLARTVRAAIPDLNLYLSACQVGITLASLVLGWIGEQTIAELLIAAFSGMPSPLSEIARHSVAVVIALMFITYLHVVFGEVAPKSMAIFHPEQVARWLVPPLMVFTRGLSPLIWAINESANVLLRVLGVRLPSEAEKVHSPEEIMYLVRRSGELGKVEHDEQAMISGVFELTHTVAREVMTPRPDIVAVPVDVKFDELVDTTSRTGHSRLPVFRESLDNVEGIVLVKDLFRVAAESAEQVEDSDFDVTRIMREPYFVPDTKPVDDLLAEFRRLKIHLAIVVDEFGGTDGLVTLEDLIEEIVGEIYDEHDVARPKYTRTARGEVLIDGGAPIDEVNEQCGIELPEEEYDTLGGFILGELGQVPMPGDVVEVGNARLVVERVDDRRVRSIRLIRLDQSESDSPTTDREGDSDSGEEGRGE